MEKYGNNIINNMNGNMRVKSFNSNTNPYNYIKLQCFSLYYR